MYQIDMVEYDENLRTDENPFYSLQADKTFVISNTAQTGQISFIQNKQNENSILFHSRFKKSDKKFLFNEVYEAFKKNGNLRYSVLRSGPIVQASLNITCQHMVSEITTPENMLQRLGRLDRFGENTTGVNVMKLAIPVTFSASKGVGNCAKFLSRNNEFQITLLWLDYLKEKLPTTPFTLEFLYGLYSEFYKTYSSHQKLINDLSDGLLKSSKLVTSKVTEPILIKSKHAKNESNVMTSSSKSLRGNNVFVQMAKCDLENPSTPKISNEYAYLEPLDDKTPIDNLSASVDFVTGYNNKKPEKNLVTKMYKVHRNIKGGDKPHNTDILIKQARSSDYPIYLSYTDEDIKHLGGNDPHAIFYCFCSNQVIGTLDLSCLTNAEDDSDE
jgi:CRISPR-associated endonuclease/helicase Cas3